MKMNKKKLFHLFNGFSSVMFVMFIMRLFIARFFNFLIGLTVSFKLLGRLGQCGMGSERVFDQLF